MKKHAYWWDIKHHDNAYYDFVPSEAEVVIIGAGIAGIAAAYWLLAEKQKQVVVIDTSPFPGYRGAGREFGMLLTNGGKPIKQLREQVGQEKADAYTQITRTNNRLLRRFVARNKIPCRLEVNGGLRLAGCVAEAQDLEEDARILNELGIGAFSMPEREIERIIPSNKLHGGLFIPGEGFLDPFGLITFVTHILYESVGLRFCQAVGNVDKIERSARGAFRKIYLDNGHVIKTRVIIHANNDTPPMDDVIIPFREHAIAGEDMPENMAKLFPRMPMLTNGGDDYYRLDATKLLSSGSRFTSNTEVPSKNDVSYNPRVYNELNASLARIFPISAITSHTHTWSFISHDTPDGLPLIGPIPDDDKQFVIAGLGSHRYSVAFMAGRLVVEQIYGRPIGAAQVFAPGRFVSKS